MNVLWSKNIHNIWCCDASLFTWQAKKYLLLDSVASSGAHVIGITVLVGGSVLLLDGRESLAVLLKKLFCLSFRVGPTMTCCTAYWVHMSVIVPTWDMCKACPSLLQFSSWTWKLQTRSFASPICSIGHATWHSSVSTKLSLVSSFCIHLQYFFYRHSRKRTCNSCVTMQQTPSSRILV